VVCEVLDRKFVRYIAFDNDPAKAIEARNRGLPVFYGDVSRPEVLQNFHVGDARMVSEIKCNFKTFFRDTRCFFVALRPLIQ